jgi:hypothetical protein
MQRAELVSGAFYLDRQPEVRRRCALHYGSVCARAVLTSLLRLHGALCDVRLASG